MPATLFPLLAFALCLLWLLTLPDPVAAQTLRERIEMRRDRIEPLRDQPGTVETLRVGGLDRHYRLVVPSSASAGAPLVIVLHGTYGTGEKMQRALGFDAHAQRLGFVVAYPDAYRPEGARQTLRWNDGRGVLASSARGIDDVAFVAALIDDIARAHRIDRDRVYVTGASNGGIMAYRLGCELKGQIRGIAAEIGALAAPIASSCTPPAGLSVLSINGVLDPFVPLQGGEVCPDVSRRLCEGGQVVSRAASMAPFARAAGCKTAPVSRRRPPRIADGTEVEVLSYTGCRPGIDLRALVVHGMGHVWPPHGGQVKGSGPTTGNLDATAEIVAFFMAQR